MADANEVVYDLGGWPDDRVGALVASLRTRRIPFVLEGSELVVPTAHEADADAVITELDGEPPRERSRPPSSGAYRAGGRADPLPPPVGPPATPPDSYGRATWWQHQSTGARVFLVGLAVVIGLTIVSALWLENDDDDTSSRSRPAPTAARRAEAAAPAAPRCQVVYRVTGSAARVSITMTLPNGATSQRDSVAVPWTHSAGCFDDFDFAVLLAQNQGERGSVTCSISRGGVTVSTSTSSGAYVIAQCSE